MANIKIVALGGLGENGKNMYVIEVDDHIFILDAGIKYPDVDMYGVDAVVADIDYLIKNKDKIEGIFVSHGHEDNIRAIPYLLKAIPTRVYGTHFTISLVETTIIEHKMDVKKYKLFRINENKLLKFGDVTVLFFNTTHSIPESVGISINTSDGSIVYCTDFCFGATNFGKYQTSYDRITDLGKNKVLALLSESIGAGTIDRIKNDSVLEHTFKNVLINSTGRIIVSAYSSDLSRIQKIVNMAVEKNKKIAIVGKKGEKIIDVAINFDYLSIPDENFVSLKPYTEPSEVRDEDLVVIVTGIRNEPYSMLVRMALGEDKLIKIKNNDTTIVMCPPIPGTEKFAIDSLNTLYRYDVNAMIFDKSILKSSHADKEDLKMLYSMLKPVYIIPIKGEYRHMYEQKLAALDAGFNESNIILADNGDVINIIDGKVENIEHVDVKDIFIDGSVLAKVDLNVIKDREILAEEGLISLIVNYDVRLRKVVSTSNITTKGLSYKISFDELNKKVIELSTRIVNNNLVRKRFELEYVELVLKEEISKLALKLTSHRPVVIPILIDVSK